MIKIVSSAGVARVVSAEIEAENEGILRVPEGKSVMDLPQSHFERLVTKETYQSIIRALTNLQTWNKNKNTELSNWAENMAGKLRKKFRPEKVDSSAAINSVSGGTWLLAINDRDDWECGSDASWHVDVTRDRELRQRAEIMGKRRNVAEVWAITPTQFKDPRIQTADDIRRVGRQLI
jgi:hypothetical protein